MKSKVCVIGLGYVGLPLAVELSKSYEVFGCDANKSKVQSINDGKDPTGELSENQKQYLPNICFSDSLTNLPDSEFYIVCVPTPVADDKRPSLDYVESASLAISKKLKRGNIVVYESTVYPGATEEVCVPLLEKESGLVLNEDFGVGYSPERINPSDKNNTLRTIKKIVSASDSVTLDRVAALYESVVDAGLYRASSIKVAEAAKALENTQRDVNIALINEMAILFERLEIDTTSVIQAAESKWNFLPFKPGLVGGHCIGVDPYYLIHKANVHNFGLSVVEAAREVNEGIISFISNKVIELCLSKNVDLRNARCLFYGAAFKEDCNDVRNSKALELADKINRLGIDVDIFDPLIDQEDFKSEASSKLNYLVEIEALYDIIILAVPHARFKDMDSKDIKVNLKEESVFIDLKSVYGREDSDYRL
ncbi:nucleotide sugar dehydrogenase [Litoribacillus peritrichatus]|uniref:Vi polysaccharide biosynthesis UDP-N-acetylglucosamine C-6 dehydrogenase TviB n=1 Tax=Litoribacillus peritrichatus TaxID=718191 RepID=A0ABP7LXW4_9GAMM